jgi:hypothetical protein
MSCCFNYHFSVMKTFNKITQIALTLFFCSSFFLLAGCGTTSVGKLGTPSGRPEVTIPNTNIQIVMDDVAAWLAVQGISIVETSIYTITSSYPKKETTDFFGYPAYYTSIYTIVQNGANVELYEKTESSRKGELTGQSDYEDMQKELTQIAEFIKMR